MKAHRNAHYQHDRYRQTHFSEISKLIATRPHDKCIGLMPDGRRKAQEPPMAIAIRKGSLDSPLAVAIWLSTGAVMITAAALLITLDHSMVMAMIKPRLYKDDSLRKTNSIKDF